MCLSRDISTFDLTNKRISNSKVQWAISYKHEIGYCDAIFDVVKRNSQEIYHLSCSFTFYIKNKEANKNYSTSATLVGVIFA